MRTPNSLVLKHWLNSGFVAVGVSCACALPFTQNLIQAGLIGLATIPGVATTILIGSRQRQRQVHRQLAGGRLRLHQLQQRGSLLTEQLQIKSQNCQAIEIRIAQLHSLAANLTDRLDLDRDRHQQLAQQLSTLSIYYQEQQDLAEKLDHKIQAKQALTLEINANLHHLQAQVAHLQSAQIQLTAANNNLETALKDHQLQIEDYLITKQELALQVQQLQHQQLVENEEFDRINEQIASQQQLNQQHESLDLLSAEIETTLTDKLLQRELKIAQLELSSRQAELDNLEFKIHNKLQSISEIDLDNSPHPFEPQLPTITRDLDPVLVIAEWSDNFIDNPHLTVLKHIEKHGAITEAEASKKLGNARSVRQFANKLEAYTQDLPFSIKVESSPKGNRYLKETQD